VDARRHSQIIRCDGDLANRSPARQIRALALLSVYTLEAMELLADALKKSGDGGMV